MKAILRHFKSISIYGFLSWLVIVFGVLYYGLQTSNGGTANNPDIGWTVRNGWMVLHHHFQSTDSYTWTIAERTRYDNSEWLSDVIIYLVYAIKGSVSVEYFTRLMYLVLLGLLIFLSYRKNQKQLLSTILFSVIGFTLLVSGGIETRPQLFTYLLLLLFYYFRERKLWIWCILVPIWANLHGEYMTFLGLFAVDQVFSKRYRNLLWLILWLGEVAIFTPMHLFTLKFPFLTLFSSDIKNYVTEWGPYPFHDTFYMGIFVLLIFYIYRAVKNADLSTRVISFCLLLLALDAVRNVALLGMFVMMNGQFPDFKGVKVRNSIVAGCFVAICTTTFFMIPTKSLAGLSHPKAIQYIESNHLQNLRWYWPLQESTYLELHYPSTKVYWDGRTDMYTGFMGGTDFMKQTMNVLLGQEPITNLPDYNRIQGFFVYDNSPLYFQLKLMPGWHQIYGKNGVYLYLRNGVRS